MTAPVYANRAEAVRLLGDAYAALTAASKQTNERVGSEVLVGPMSDVLGGLADTVFGLRTVLENQS